MYYQYKWKRKCLALRYNASSKGRSLVVLEILDKWNKHFFILFFTLSMYWIYIDRLVQGRHISFANALKVYLLALTCRYGANVASELSSVAPRVVAMTTFGAASDEMFGNMISLNFCLSCRVGLRIWIAYWYNNGRDTKLRLIPVLVDTTKFDSWSTDNWLEII